MPQKTKYRNRKNTSRRQYNKTRRSRRKTLRRLAQLLKGGSPPGSRSSSLSASSLPRESSLDSDPLSTNYSTLSSSDSNLPTPPPPASPPATISTGEIESDENLSSSPPPPPPYPLPSPPTPTSSPLTPFDENIESNPVPSPSPSPENQLSTNLPSLAINSPVDTESNKPELSIEDVAAAEAQSPALSNIYPGIVEPNQDIEGLNKIDITDEDLTPPTEPIDPLVLGTVQGDGTYLFVDNTNNAGIKRSYDPTTNEIRKVLITEMPSSFNLENVDNEFATPLKNLEGLLEKLKAMVPEFMEVVYGGTTYVISKNNPYIVVQKAEESLNSSPVESSSSNPPAEISSLSPANEFTPETE